MQSFNLYTIYIIVLHSSFSATIWCRETIIQFPLFTRSEPQAGRSGKINVEQVLHKKADPIFYEEIDRQNLKRKRWNKDKLIQLVTSRSFRYKRKVKKEFPIKVSCWHWSRHISWARCTHSFTQDEYIRTFSALRWCRT